MSWTRNLGLQKSEAIADALEATTWETIPVKNAAGDVLEHKHNMLNAADRALVAPVVAAARAGVEAMGGEAFVHCQGQNMLITRHQYGDGGPSPDGAPRMPETIVATKAVRVKCIVVTITTETELEG